MLHPVKMKKLFSKKETTSDAQLSFVGKVYTFGLQQYVVEDTIAEGELFKPSFEFYDSRHAHILIISKLVDFFYFSFFCLRLHVFDSCYVLISFVGSFL